MNDLMNTVYHTLSITIFVFLMMLIVDYLNVLTKGRVTEELKVRPLSQYTLSSFLGVTPGCIGAFLNVTLYARGVLTFGAIVAGMVATSGDEAFVMLALFPKTAVLLFGILFILGIIAGGISDRFFSFLKIKRIKVCEVAVLHNEEKSFLDLGIGKNKELFSPIRILFLSIILISWRIVTTGDILPLGENWQKILLFLLFFPALLIVSLVPRHYLIEHIWRHIIRTHIWRVFLWTLFSFIFIHIGLESLNFRAIVETHMVWVLLISAVIGLIPETGPHLIFVSMFAEGTVPFSVLLTSSIVQDGHGMLPLLSYSVRDSVLIKLFKFLFGIGVGYTIYILGF